MKDLKSIAAEKYPYEKPGDTIEELRIDRQRFAFEAGVRWAIRQFMDVFPEENKLRDNHFADGYNTALEQTIENFENWQKLL